MRDPIQFRYSKICNISSKSVYMNYNAEMYLFYIKYIYIQNEYSNIFIIAYLNF